MKSSSSKRNSGIDCLRIISTYSIILLHIMGHGGIRDSLSPGNINYYVLWFVMLAAFCGVNCFGLISGYVGYHEKEKPHKSSRFIELWCQVVFYCINTVIVFKALKMPGIGARDFVEAFLPITFERYWYFSAYLGVFIFMPFINKCVREFSDKYLVSMFVVGVGSLSFLATVMTRYSDPFVLKGGYGAVWLIFLYFIGAVIKKFRVEQKIQIPSLLLVIMACLVITWIWKVALISIVGHGLDDMLVIYISPTILLMSVCLLILFSKLTFNEISSKIISLVAPTTFGIYLFQDSDYFRRYIVAGHYVSYGLRNPFVMVCMILLTGVVQFVAGFLLEKCRVVIFKTLRIKNLSNRIGEKIDTSIDKVTKWAEERLGIENIVQ